MIEQIVSWALEQAPAITVLVIGFYALWKANRQQQDVIIKMLSLMLEHILKESEESDK